MNHNVKFPKEIIYDYNEQTFVFRRSNKRIVS